MKKLVDIIYNLTRKLEEIFHLNDQVLLKNCHRSIQLDNYSCGVQAAGVILRYYGIECSFDKLKEFLKTDEDGTSYLN